MSRIRSVHPGQWTDDAFVGCSPLARLLALSMRNFADDNGVFEWNPIKLKMTCLPGDTCDVVPLLAELEAANIVRPYEFGGRKLGLIRKFKKFQSPKSPTYAYSIGDDAEIHAYISGSISEIEDDDEGQLGKSAVVKRRRMGKDSGNSSAEGEERRGEESKKKNTPPRKTGLPDGFAVSDRVRAWAAEKGFDRLPEHLASFKNKAQAKGYTYVDWDSAFMEAIREDWAKLRGSGARGAGPLFSGSSSPPSGTERAADPKLSEIPV